MAKLNLKSNFLYCFPVLRLKPELFDMVVERIGQPLEEVETDCDRDFHLTAPQAIAYGLIDDILKSHKKS